MSLLTMAQDAADDIGIPRPTAVIGSTDPTTRIMLAAANREGRNLAKRHPWQALKMETTFLTVADDVQTASGAVPAGFDRLIADTMWNRTQKVKIGGPITEAEYADFVGRGVGAVYPFFRFRGNKLLLTPDPTAGETYAYEYISKYWCGGSASTAPTQSAWAADDDIPYLDEEAMRLGIIWRYKKSRGLEYGQDFNDYEAYIAQLAGRDGARRVLDMGKSNLTRNPRAPVAPDFNWPLS